MKYTSEFAENIRQLDMMVILQKEYDLYEHKKRHIRKMMVIHHNTVYENQLQHEFRDVVRHMKLLERQMNPAQEIINCPRSMINRYIELYQVSIPSVARTLRISTSAITLYLQKGIKTPDIKSFIYWAIRNFRLDANRYWNLLESLNQQEVI